MVIDEKELALAKTCLPIYKAAAGDYHWPEEVGRALSHILGKDWCAWVLMAIGSRESRQGLLLDADDLGDKGHGHGIMQIDDRSRPAFCDSGKWRDLAASLDYIHHNVLVPGFNYLGDKHFDLFGGEETPECYAALFWGAIAAYNCGAGNVVKALKAGEGVDARTTGRNYSADVRARALKLRQKLGGESDTAII